MANVVSTYILLIGDVACVLCEIVSCKIQVKLFPKSIFGVENCKLTQAIVILTEQIL